MSILLCPGAVALSAIAGAIEEIPITIANIAIAVIASLFVINHQIIIFFIKSSLYF
jgi:hypothetical protein